MEMPFSELSSPPIATMEGVTASFVNAIANPNGGSGSEVINRSQPRVSIIIDCCRGWAVGVEAIHGDYSLSIFGPCLSNMIFDWYETQSM